MTGEIMRGIGGEFGAFRTLPPVSSQAGPADVRLKPLEAVSWPHIDGAGLSAGAHMLLWVQAGQMVLTPTGGAARRTIEAGELCFVPMGGAQGLRPTGRVAGRLLLIGPDMAARLSNPLPDAVISARLSDTDAAALRVNLGQILAFIARQGETARQNLWREVDLIAIRLARLGNDGQPTPVALAPEAGLDPRPLVRDFLDLVARNPGRGITVADLAGQLEVSAADLDRACLGARGKRALDLIYDLRMERAFDALKNSAAPAQAIARDLGFTSYAHFCRVFVQETGRLPDAYRAGTVG
ncbi:MAG: AraC family transcriptional regulator [Paracoccus sp. (in: a-proteobacteria)]|nr:AraC family transcriptional regulator [Paracoccus sp. (in: a-proteobacteria)]